MFNRYYHFYSWIYNVCICCCWFVVGFISDLIKKLWGELEIADDSPVYTPKYWPINPIDKAAKKVKYWPINPIDKAAKKVKYWPINPIDKAAKKVCDNVLLSSVKYCFATKSRYSCSVPRKT